MGDPDLDGADLAREVAAFARGQELFAGLQRVLVACSGGGDSVALLDLISGLASEIPLDLAVVHVNHGWRGEEATQDEAFVARLSAARGLRFLSCSAEPPPPSGSLEEHFRDQRLALYRRAAHQVDADAVALGHTLDDQAETILMNLARGAGPRGLGGMRPRARVRGVTLLRPLLGVRRERLRRYARARGLMWREDSSNEDLRFLRNRFRRSILPAFESLGPRIIDNIARAAGVVRQEEEWLEALAGEQLAEITRSRAPNRMALALAPLQRLPLALQRRVLRAAMRQLRGDLKGIHLQHLDAVAGEVLGGRETARDLPGVRVRVRGTELELLRLENRRVASEASTSKDGPREP